MPSMLASVLGSWGELCVRIPGHGGPLAVSPDNPQHPGTIPHPCSLLLGYKQRARTEPSYLECRRKEVERERVQREEHNSNVARVANDITS